MTALVAQLMREQRSAEDRAIFDAYNNGGLYKGKPVTDDRILAHMKSRRDGFTKDDPLYDQWNNQVIQQTFSIGEQKIGLAFQQGKVGAGAVASFYRNALKSVPKDSAFYREVAGRAAQWAKSASGAARGRARGRATSGLRDKLNAELQGQGNYLALEQALTAYAQREGLISGSQKLTDADATDLQDMFDRGIWAGKDQITFIDFQSAAKDHYKSIQKEYGFQVALGNQGVEARNKLGRFLNETLVGLNAVDDRAKYEMARDKMVEDVRLAGKDPYAIQEAYNAYATALEGIHQTAVNAKDANAPEFIGGLVNEWKAVKEGKATGNGVYDLYDMFDAEGGVQNIAESVAAANADIEAVAKSKAFYGQSEPGGALSVQQFPQGGFGLDDSWQPSISTINGKRRVVYLKGEQVKSSVVSIGGQVIDPADPASGALIQQARAEGTLTVTESESGIGYVFTNPATGKVKYGVYDAEGQMMFTDANPWSDIVYNGGVPTVFTSQATESENGKLVPATTGLVTRPVDIDTADPFLSDGRVAPKDLLSMLDEGTTGVSLSEEQIEKYRMRLHKEERDRLVEMSQRGPGGIGNLGAGYLGNSEMTRGGGGDLRSSILEGMNSIKNVTTGLFGGKELDDATVFGAPPETIMPRPPGPWQGTKPDGTPKDVVRLTPDTPDRYAPEPEVRNYSPHQPAPKASKPPALTPYKPGETDQKFLRGQ